MTTLATTLQAFFTDRLVRQRQVSPNTLAAYRDTLRLFLVFASAQKRKEPSKLEFNDLDAPLVGAFLDHLEQQRENGVRTRNARLAAIRSLFRYAALRHPELAALIERVLAIPPKRFERRLITFLTEPEVDALLAAPDRTTRTGRRDHALFGLATQSGLRFFDGVSRVVWVLLICTVVRNPANDFFGIVSSRQRTLGKGPIPFGLTQLRTRNARS